MKWLKRALRSWLDIPTIIAPPPAEVKPAQKPMGLNISHTLLASFADADSTQENAWGKTFKVPQPLPGVLPTEGAEREAVKLAMDSMQDYYGTAIGSMVFAEGMEFLGYPYLSELTQRPEYRRPAEILAKAMTMKWIKLTYTGGKDAGKKLKQLESEMKRLGVQDCFQQAVEQDAFFGRSQIFIDTGSTDPNELKLPLTPEAAKVSVGSIKRLKVVEPIWTYPGMYVANDPLDPEFFKPTSWFVMGKQIHRTRLLTFVSREVPDLLKPSYAFGGLSLSQMLKPYVDNWLRTRQAVSDLLVSFNVPVLKTNLDDILTAGAATLLTQRVKLWNTIRSNLAVFALNKNTEEFEHISAQLANLDKLQAQSQEHMSSVTGIPLIIYFGITPAGLSATAQPELDVFYEWIAALQQMLMSMPLTLIISYLQLNLWGAIDPDIGFTFEPLEGLDGVELSTLQKTKAETGQIYINAGVIDPAEERERVAKSEDSDYSEIDVNDVPESPQDKAARLGLGGDPQDGPGGAGGAGGGKPGGQPTGQPPGPFKPKAVAGMAKDAREWNEEGVNRVPSGKTEGGEFAPKGSGGGSAKAPEHADAKAAVSYHKAAAQSHAKAAGAYLGKGHEAAAEAHQEAAQAASQHSGQSVVYPVAARKAHGASLATGWVQSKGGNGGDLSPAPEDREQWPDHIKRLKVPPAWDDVRISLDPNAALQVVGRDAKGRRQAVYSAKWNAAQAASKFARLQELDTKFQSIQDQNSANQKSGQPLVKELADAMSLVMLMGVRPGSNADTGADKKAYGATTLEGRHVVSKGDEVRLQFGGKDGVSLDLPVDDPDLANMLRERAQQVGNHGRLFPNVDADRLLQYSHSFDGGGFKTKDFRTLLGTRVAMREIERMPAPTDSTAYKKAVRQVAKVVAEKLGNTPVVALQSYINPAAFSGWRAGSETPSASDKLHEMFDRITKPDGGFTYQPVTKEEPKDGFALSIYPDRSFAKPATALKYGDLTRFVKRNADKLKDYDHYVGAWHDPQSDQVFLDVSMVTHDPKQAATLAKQHDQIAYFDLAKMESVDVNRAATSGGVAKTKES